MAPFSFGPKLAFAGEGGEINTTVRLAEKSASESKNMTREDEYRDTINSLVSKEQGKKPVSIESNNSEEFSDELGKISTEGISNIMEEMGLFKVNKPDAAADALSERIGGVSRVKFAGTVQEFDAINSTFIGQTKSALQSISSAFRKQAKATFEVAQEKGLDVYYHFEGTPAQSVVSKLNEYSQRYDVKLVIDTKPLK